MNVGRIMTVGVYSCHADDTCHTAAKLMWDHDFGCVPVVDELSRVVGMITDRDICMAAFTQARAPQDIRVGSAMAAKVVTCRPEQPVALAEHLMRERRVRRLPVVDEQGKLLGILSINDIAIDATRQRRSAAQPSPLDMVGATLAAICEHGATSRAA